MNTQHTHTYERDQRRVEAAIEHLESLHRFITSRRPIETAEGEFRRDQQRPQIIPYPPERNEIYHFGFLLREQAG